MAPALAAMASRATTAIHVRKVFFIIEISSLQLTSEKNTLEILPSRDPITSYAFLFLDPLICWSGRYRSFLHLRSLRHLRRFGSGCQEEKTKNMLRNH